MNTQKQAARDFAALALAAALLGAVSFLVVQWSRPSVSPSVSERGGQ